VKFTDTVAYKLACWCSEKGWPKSANVLLDIACLWSDMINISSYFVALLGRAIVHPVTLAILALVTTVATAVSAIK
jgi:hypothetical protein